MKWQWLGDALGERQPLEKAKTPFVVEKNSGCCQGVWLDNYTSGENGAAPLLITRWIPLKRRHSRRTLKWRKLSYTHTQRHAQTHTHTETKSETHWQGLLLLEYTYFKKVKTNWKENRHNGGNSNSLSNRCRLRVNTESLRCFITAASKAIIIPRSALRLQVAASWWIGSKLFLHKESTALYSRQFQFGASILTTNSPNLVNKL